MKTINISNLEGFFFFVLWTLLTQLEMIFLAISVAYILTLTAETTILVLFPNLRLHTRVSFFPFSLSSLIFAPSTFLQMLQRRKFAMFLCDPALHDLRTELHRVCESC